MNITGYKEAAENFEACMRTGLRSRFRVDCDTGEVWATESASGNDMMTNHDPAVYDITFDVLEEQTIHYMEDGKSPALSELVRQIAEKTCAKYEREKSAS